MANFRINLEIFRGPIDLLHFLVRKNEIEISEISLASIIQQYQEYLDILTEIDINLVGDFIDVASQLVEIKTRTVLPKNELEQDESQYQDPREDLVHRLLVYKEFKQAASLLNEQGRQWQQRYTRVADDLPPRKIDLVEQPIQEIELWDLVSAFGRVMRDNRPPPEENIYYDETPIHIYMNRIRKKITDKKRIAFSEMFEPGMHKSAMVGVFLAILELARHHSVSTEQSEEHGEIWVVPGPDFEIEIDPARIDDFDPNSQGPAGDPASLVDKSL
jgi:segregation and condensation protein A